MADDGINPVHGTRVTVECYEGYRAQETPRRLTIAGCIIEVRQILDRWAGVDHRYFKVAGSDGRAYLLRYDESEHTWTLVSCTRP